ncbi:hypothetical protein E1A91_A12G116400v1 [Gossypium mustelinum]|uniref:Uncharacterized protein n=1 Tax=Gossypium mustelinum TaxID=34275 RepID=A0A5D2WSZ8_GOSMU|nr:hypothetical protein E1A91_A12G116400v1 [Gossypium mustelinum]
MIPGLSAEKILRCSGWWYYIYYSLIEWFMGLTTAREPGGLCRLALDHGLLTFG